MKNVTNLEWNSFEVLSRDQMRSLVGGTEPVGCIDGGCCYTLNEACTITLKSGTYAGTCKSATWGCIEVGKMNCQCN